ncbi:hypothetical protein HNR03_004924 [Pseudomonas sp. JAI111]|uniref:hypothetical protein n=1 Tax=Pseudomonas sp. JAI111 TaxID=2735913 RepID=UPI002167B9D3|nr:hypothetical protein [Pseudomonas sp. JAI111]MCS3840300.1 hypothetical protein [Pseudomonas sp. JAI111]
MRYDELACLTEIYLEDSYVLAIEEGQSTLVFNMDLVLLESHPFYKKPSAGEHYCYQRADILFRETECVSWQKRSDLVSVDEDGEVDFGNIDTFVADGRNYMLSGDWGAVSVTCDALMVKFHLD